MKAGEWSTWSAMQVAKCRAMCGPHAIMPAKRVHGVRRDDKKQICRAPVWTAIQSTQRRKAVLCGMNLPSCCGGSKSHCTSR